MDTTTYDYIIIGAGLAGLQLALAFLEDEELREKSVLLVDQSDKKLNDKTWCFWEKGSGLWDEIVFKNWEMAYFHSEGFSKKLKLDPYQYKMIHSLDFYNYALNKIQKKDNFHFIVSEVDDVRHGAVPEIQLNEQMFEAKYVFDSRVSWPEQKKHPVILQHFKGWFLKTTEPVFDPGCFTMMDFRLRWKDACCFTYILPTSSHEALVEFTFFNEEVVEENVYDQMLSTYLRDYLQIREYKIESVEKGVIPMTSIPFHESSKENVLKIGTAGSWVKPSTGYSFKNSEKNARHIVRNIKNGVDPINGLINAKSRWYDSLFIDVLFKHNSLGPKLFELMYNKNSVQSIFKFLDEETGLVEDVKIMSSFPKSPFINALVKRII
jgi:lycopene beta-cyclase